MAERTSSMTCRITRRGFLGRLAVAGAAMGWARLIPCGVLLGSALDSRVEVVSFHMDQPYLDPTGKAAPYHPPSGARSASPVAHLSEEAFRSSQAYA
ncbi:MAG TPA: twin-arginine translocation signal domain-containing protein [Candidatus Cybelea sp.]|jgi:hypothetical protein|nr:twin-arginine translocation signal domain-containing protein [Candidatus Cybelea sp.]